MKQESLTVADCMTPARNTIPETANVTEAVQLLLKHKMLGSAVIDDQQHLVGYISEQDCLKHLITDSYYRENTTLVSEIMRKDVLTMSGNMSIIDLAQIMTQDKPKKYPVTDHRRLIGEITRTDVLAALLRLRVWQKKNT
jgi:CBS-domain-containing membrane protein